MPHTLFSRPLQERICSDMTTIILLWYLFIIFTAHEILGTCNCDHHSPGHLLYQKNCNSDSICPVVSPPSYFHACLIEHIPRRTSDRVDIIYSCVESPSIFGVYCNEAGMVQGFENYSIVVRNWFTLNDSVIFTHTSNAIAPWYQKYKAQGA